jgi:preprotein translocase subunit YajC
VYNVLLLAGATTGGSAPKGGNPFLSFLPLLLIIFVMYFLLLRPQAKRQKQQQEMIKNLQKGDKVLTTGGIVGTIAGIKEKEGLLILKIADNVKVELARQSVTQLLNQKAE